MYRYDGDTKKYVFDQKFTSDVYSADWSSDGLTLFLGHDKVLEVYSCQPAGGKCAQTAKLEDAQDKVVSVDVSGAKNEWLASASVDKFVYIYKLEGTVYKLFTKKNYLTEGAQQISFSNDGTLLAATFQSKALVYQYGIDCSEDKHSTKSRSTDVSCQCVQNFVWDGTNFRCDIDCSKVPYSDGASAGYEKCGCKPRFIWKTETYECWLDCTSDPFSTKINTGPATCACK